MRYWPLHDSDVNSTSICLEINGLTEFWLKLYACANRYTRPLFSTPAKYEGLGMRLAKGEAQGFQIP